MKKLTAVAGLIALLCAWPRSAAAQAEYEWYSPKRLVVAARFERIWWDQEIGRPLDKEWGAGIAASWGLVPNLSLTARFIHGLDSNEDHLAIGLSLKFFDGMRDLR